MKRWVFVAATWELEVADKFGNPVFYQSKAGKSRVNMGNLSYFGGWCVFKREFLGRHVNSHAVTWRSSNSSLAQ